MRYMLLIYNDERARDAEPEHALHESMQRAQAVMAEMNRAGIFEGADALQPTTTATTLLKQDGKVLITDGPFAETKEQLAGYIILNCRDLDEALEWAGKMPSACGGVGRIEVRPIREIPGFGKKEAMDLAGKVHG